MGQGQHNTRDSRRKEVEARLAARRELQARTDAVEARERSVEARSRASALLLAKTREIREAIAKDKGFPVESLHAIDAMRTTMQHQLSQLAMFNDHSPSTYSTGQSYVPHDNHLVIQLMDAMEDLFETALSATARLVVLSYALRNRTKPFDKKVTAHLDEKLGVASRVEPQHVTYLDEVINEKSMLRISDGKFGLEHLTALDDFDALVADFAGIMALRDTAIQYARTCLDMSEDLKCGAFMTDAVRKAAAL